MPRNDLQSERDHSMSKIKHDHLGDINKTIMSKIKPMR